MSFKPKSKETIPLIVIINSFSSGVARCSVNVLGSLIPTSFPLEIINALKLKEGDKFEWIPVSGRKVKVSDCKPIPKNDLSEKEYQGLTEIYSALADKLSEE